MVQKPIIDGQARTLDRTDPDGADARAEIHAAQSDELAGVANEVEQAMSDLIDRELVDVRRHGKWVEVEIRTDILFPSGIATLSPQAEQVLHAAAPRR